MVTSAFRPPKRINSLPATTQIQPGAMVSTAAMNHSNAVDFVQVEGEGNRLQIGNSTSHTTITNNYSIDQNAARFFDKFLATMANADKQDNAGSSEQISIAKLKGYKVLVENWSREVGLHDGVLVDGHHKALDNPDTLATVQEILKTVSSLYSNDGDRKHQGPTSSRSAQPGNAKQAAQLEDLTRLLRAILPSASGREDANSGLGRTVERNADKNDWSNNVLEAIKDWKAQIRSEEKAQLHHWIMGPKTSDGTELYKYKRLKDTADWLLAEESFVRWMDPEYPDNTAKVLWIHGPAGFGKSFLCARVVEYLSESLEKPLAWFFLSGDSEVRRDPFTALRSWIFQMLQDASVFDLVRKEWIKHQDPTATQDDTIRIFGMLVRHVNCTFVLDGLDECAVATDSKPARFRSPISQFLDTISEAVKTTRTKILITSRADPEIQQNMPRTGVTALELRLEEANLKQDILLYARSIVTSALQDETESVREDITARLADRCQGQFLWLRLQHDELEGAHNRAHLEKVISETPSGLAFIYERNYNKIVCSTQRNRDRALAILRWTAFALRPLTVAELTDALLIVAGNETFSVADLPESINRRYVNSSIVKICEGLIEVRKSTSTEDLGQATVHLQHFTVKEYLIQVIMNDASVNNTWTTHTPTMIQHTALAISCIGYLNLSSTWIDHTLDETKDDQLLGQSFRKYAANSWMQHVNMADRGNPDLRQCISSFFAASNTNWDAWEKWTFTSESGMESLESAPFGNRLHYACQFNLSDVVGRVLFEQPELVNQASPTGTTALYLACRGEFRDIISMLLEKGANASLARKTGATPLQMACQRGNLGIVQALVNSQKIPADFVQSDNGAFNSACYHGSLELVQFLIDHGADVSGQDDQGRTPVHAAAGSGNEDILRLLIRNKATLNKSKSGTHTPIYTACVKGYTGIVKLLAEQGADIDAVSTEEQWSPLQAASEFGFFDIMEILVKHGADIHLHNKYGESALLVAAANGKMTLLEFLITNKADVLTVTHEGWTAIAVAAERGYKDCVSLLIRHGANVNEAGYDGQAPLCVASESGYADIVQLLLDNGADTAIATSTGLTALHFASENGHTEVVRLLVEKGAKVPDITVDGWYPMLYAIRAGQLDIIKLLFKRYPGIVPMSQGIGFAFTPMQAAAMSGSIEIGNFLLDQGIGVSGKSLRSTPPLCIAANRGHVEFVQFLIDNGSDMSAVDEDGCNCVYSAASKGHLEVVRLLVSRGGDAEATSQFQKTPLLIACQNGHEEVVEYLLSEKVCTDVASSQDGSTPVHWASANGHLKIVQMLVKHGADISKRDITGQNALFEAVANNEKDVVRYLIKCGADIEEARDQYGWSAVHEACEASHLQALEELIRYKANLTGRSGDGSTPLHVASKVGSTAIVDLLIKQGVDTAIKDKAGCTPLHKACELGHIEAVKLLLEHGADIHARNKNGDYPIATAARAAQMNIVEHLCHRGSDTNDDGGDDGDAVLMIVCSLSGNNMLHEELLWKNMNLSSAQRQRLWSTMDKMQTSRPVEVVKTLLAHGAEFPINGSLYKQHAPLTFACKNGNVELVELLLERCSVDLLQRHAATFAFAALSSYDLDILQILYDNGVDIINVTDEEGKTALHEACKLGADDIASCLLQHGANITAMSNDGLFPIHSACQSRTWDTAQRLIIYGADPNMRSRKGTTPLMVACQSGSLEVVHKLLSRYANVHDTDDNGVSPLHFALLQGHALPHVSFQVTELLLKSGADLNCLTTDGRLPLHYACLGKSTMILEYLEHHGVDMMSKTLKNDTPLHFTATLKNGALTEFFLERGASAVAVNASGVTPLHVAASNGNLQVVKLLLENGASPSAMDNSGRTALYAAAKHGHKDVTECLIEADATVVAASTAMWTPLHAASANGHAEIVQLLIDNGAKVNAATGASDSVHLSRITSNSGNSEFTESQNSGDDDTNRQQCDVGHVPLHCAAEGGYDSVVLLLLKNGAKVDVQIQETGTTALHYAAKSGNAELVTLLLEHGADVGETDDGGWTPLHFAALEGHLEVTKLLATSDTALNHAEQTGWRPIHCAAKSGNEELVLFLLEKGADATVVDCNGSSPATIAQENGHTKIAEQLSASSSIGSYLLSFF